MRLIRRKQYASEIGWISVADIFILTSCLFFVFAVTIARKTNERLPSSVAELQELVIDLEKERDKLASVRNEKDERIRGHTVKETRLLRDLDSAQQLSSTLRRRITELETEKEVISSGRDILQQGLANLQQRATLLQQERDKIGYDFERLSATQDQQKRLNNELLGLGGDLRKVVIMVDVSESMKSDKSFGDKTYWQQTIRIISRWVYNLDVGSVALILFGDGAELALPMAPLDAGHRQRIVELLEQTNPTARRTDFLAAFRRAYEIDGVDTIIVFSDGLPSVDIAGNEIQSAGGRKGGETENEYSNRRALVIKENVDKVLEVHSAISSLAKLHAQIAVNAVGLGDKVYTRETGNLLNDLALRNGGVFIAIPPQNRLGN